MKITMIFIDGFGIGEDDKHKNPFKVAETKGFNYIFNNYRIFNTDTTLGVDGLPQSATGQTTIFTGVNAAKVLGRHLNAQPNEILKKIIYKNNIFLELKKNNLKVTNSNVYRDSYIENLYSGGNLKPKPSVTTIMTHSAKIKFRTIKDYNDENGIYHDLSGDILENNRFHVDKITPEMAAQRLFNISRENDFTLFEFFLTDIIGHKKNLNKAVEIIERLDKFLYRYINLIDLDNEAIVITSDHGNIEDSSIGTHTFNNVPTMLINNRLKNEDFKVKDLCDIMPMLLKISKY